MATNFSKADEILSKKFGSASAGFESADSILSQKYGASDPFTSTVKSTAAGMLNSFAGQPVEDIGQQLGSETIQGLGRNVREYAEGVQRANPSNINSLGDIAEHPIDAAKVALGNVLPQLPVSAAGAYAGATAGGVLGTAIGGPAGTAIGATIGGIGGAFLPNYAQEYTEMRGKQREAGQEDMGKAALYALPAAGLETASDVVMAGKFLPDAVKKGALGKAIGSFGDETLSATGSRLAHVGKEGLKGAASEAGTEYLQTGLEQLGGNQSLDTEQAANERNVSAALGGIGGGAVRGGLSAFDARKPAPPAWEAPDYVYKGEGIAGPRQQWETPIATNIPSGPLGSALQTAGITPNATTTSQTNLGSIGEQIATGAGEANAAYPTQELGSKVGGLSAENIQSPIQTQAQEPSPRRVEAVSPTQSEFSQEVSNERGIGINEIGNTNTANENYQSATRTNFQPTQEEISNGKSTDKTDEKTNQTRQEGMLDWEVPSSKPYYDGTFNSKQDAQKHIDEFGLKNRVIVKNKNDRFDVTIDPNAPLEVQYENISRRTPETISGATGELQGIASRERGTNGGNVGGNTGDAGRVPNRGIGGNDSGQPVSGYSVDRVALGGENVSDTYQSTSGKKATPKPNNANEDLARNGKTVLSNQAPNAETVANGNANALRQELISRGMPEAKADILLNTLNNAPANIDKNSLAKGFAIDRTDKTNSHPEWVNGIDFNREQTNGQQHGNNDARQPNATKPQPTDRPVSTEGDVKQPWEMTQKEFVEGDNAGRSPYELLIGATDNRRWRSEDRAKAQGYHKWNVVKRALDEGKPVPQNVLAEYPDLQEKYNVSNPHKGAFGNNAVLQPSNMDENVSRRGQDLSETDDNKIQMVAGVSQNAINQVLKQPVQKPESFTNNEQKVNNGQQNKAEAEITNLLESLDNFSGSTESHSINVARITSEFAAHLGIDEKSISQMSKAAALHDVGKMGVDISILEAARRLTDEERAAMAGHSSGGAETLKSAPKSIRRSAILAALHHHSTNGRVKGLTPKQNNLVQVIKIADVFESLTSKERAKLYRKDDLKQEAKTKGINLYDLTEQEEEQLNEDIKSGKYDDLIKEITSLYYSLKTMLNDRGHYKGSLLKRFAMMQLKNHANDISAEDRAQILKLIGSNIEPKQPKGFHVAQTLVSKWARLLKIDIPALAENSQEQGFNAFKTVNAISLSPEIYANLEAYSDAKVMKGVKDLAKEFSSHVAESVFKNSAIADQQSVKDDFEKSGQDNFHQFLVDQSAYWLLKNEFTADVSTKSHGILREIAKKIRTFWNNVERNFKAAPSVEEFLNGIVAGKPVVNEKLTTKIKQPSNTESAETKDEGVKQAKPQSQPKQEGVKYSSTQSTKDAYEKRIDELFSGADAKRGQGVKVLDKSDMLDLLGYGGKPVRLVESKVLEGMYNHRLSKDDWKKVPEWLENPAMVFNSETKDGRLVFIAPDTVKGDLVRVIVQPTESAIDVHVLVNAYDASKTPISRWLSDGLLRYADRNKIPGLRRTVGRQLPEVNTYLSQGSKSSHSPNRESGHLLPSSNKVTYGSNKIVYTERDLVKYRNANSAKLSTGSQSTGSTVADIKSLLPRRVQKLVEAGKIRIDQSTDKGEGVEAYYDSKQDVIVLVADNLTQDKLNQTLAHELVHRGLTQDDKLKAAHTRFESYLKGRFNAAKKGLGTAIEKEAYQRVVNAETPLKDQLEEFSAYMVTAYSKNPDSITGVLRKAFNDFVAAIRAFLIRNGLDLGFIKTLTPADLAALSKYGAKVASNKVVSGNLQPAEILKSAQAQGYKGTNTGEAEEWLRAKAKGLDMSDKARTERAKAMGFDVDTVWYHGTRREFDSFDIQYPKGAIGNPKGAYFTKDKSIAREYSEDVDGAIDEKSRVIAVYLKNPTIKNSLTFGDEAIINDPANIRSINAAFDPDYKDSGNLLASVAPDQKSSLFQRWFGGSKMKRGGEPIKFYHGTNADFTVFDKGKLQGSTNHTTAALGHFFTENKAEAYQYGNNVHEVFLSVKNPYVVTSDLLDKRMGDDPAKFADKLKAQGFDGLYVKDAKYAIIFDANQAKLTSNQSPTFGDDIRYSHAPTWAKEFADTATDKIRDHITTSKTFSALNNSVNTQAYKAWKDKDYKPVFDESIAFEQDIAKNANEAADLAPSLLPKLEGLVESAREIVKGYQRMRDAKAVGKAIFDTTQQNKKLMSYDQLKQAGLNDNQITMYQEFFAAVNKSLDDLVKSELYRAARALKLKPASQNLTPRQAANYYVQQIEDEPADFFDEDAQKLAKEFTDKVDQIDKLKREGYAPLQRFGQYTVNVQKEGKSDPEYFGMYETEAEANEDYRLLKEEYPDAVVTRGIMSQEDWQMFKGVTPETMETFAKLMGIDQEKAFQEYLKLGVNNRSALKRLIHRKGTKGYVYDPQRVLATFITSNARMASKNLHMGEMLDAISRIPKEKGDVKDEAVELYNYVQNPAAAGAAVRGALFSWYLGGSVAAAAVNLTQNFTTTYPALHQIGSAKQVALELGRAMKLAANPEKLTGDIKTALNRAAEEGVTEPQELHMLYGESMRTGFAGMLKPLRPIMNFWGKFFSIAEAYNRRVAFIAAYNLAKSDPLLAQKFAEKYGIQNNPFKIAEHMVQDTQFIYSKTNRPDWARGAVGSTVFTFKMFTINYLEFLKKMPVKERSIALGVLLLLAGASGAPGADDLDDLIDTIGQSLGYNTNAKGWKEQHINKFILYGMSSVLPIDISSRVGVQNVIPGTALLKRSESNKMRDIMEIAGPAGSLGQKIVNAFDAASGRQGIGAKIMAAKDVALPKALSDLAKAYDMAETGMYRDSNGKKITDISTGDIIAKGIGFQPSKVAETRRPEQNYQQEKGLTVKVEGEIASLWADGVFEKDRSKVEEAKALLKDWNEKNPKTPIRIDMRQVLKRVSKMRENSAKRLIKSSPRELRNYAKESLK